MSDSRRIEDLKRRVQQDPASIAFAALADEYRRAGLFHDAIETCRAGLLRHPAYLSARVTLGRSLLEVGEYEEAQTHLEQVLRSAPDNLAAIRALAELHDRRADASLHAAMAAPDPPAAEPPAPVKPAVVERAIPPAPAAATPPAAAVPLAPLPMRADSAPLEIVRHEFTADAAPESPLAARGVSAEAPAPAAPPPASATPRVTAAPGVPLAAPPVAEPSALPSSPLVVDPACERLEEFLAAIERARESQNAPITR